MAISELKAWVTQPSDYFAGCDLYEKYCDNRFKLFQLRLGENNDNLSFLIEELKDVIARESKKDNEVKGISIPSDYDSLPDEIKSLINQAKQLYKENAARHAQLLLVKTDRERGELANLILDNDDEARGILNQIDYYKLNNQVMKVDQSAHSDTMNLADVISAISRIRSKISKDKKKSRNTDDGQKTLNQLIQLRDELS